LDYNFDIARLKSDLDKKGIQVTIENVRYKELCNVVYRLRFNEELLKQHIEPPHTEDAYERMDLLSSVSEMLTLFKVDTNSRRAVFCNTYLNSQRGKCISLVHAFLRHGSVFINEYYRSQCLDNFEYDWQTATMIMAKLSFFTFANPGVITVFCANFHKKI